MDTPKPKDLGKQGIKLGFGAMGLYLGKLADSFIPQVHPIVNQYAIPAVGALGAGYAATKVSSPIGSAILLGFAMFMGAKVVSNAVAALPFVPENAKDVMRLSGAPVLLGMGQTEQMYDEFTVETTAAPMAPQSVSLL